MGSRQVRVVWTPRQQLNEILPDGQVGQTHSPTAAARATRRCAQTAAQYKENRRRTLEAASIQLSLRRLALSQPGPGY